MKDGPGKTAAQQQYDYLMANSDLQPEDILQLLKFAKEPPKPERAT